ncbi:MAG: molybdopterin dinucleotide binding domain-containing protein, partial [Clostridiales bacterium]
IPNAFVELNPVDAAKMGIEDGEIVRVISRINQVEVAAKIMAPNEIIGGSCQFTHGWKDADVNKLTIDDEFDPIDGFPKHKSVPVRIEKLAR